jgi:hypothetical protein
MHTAIVADQDIPENESAGVGNGDAVSRCDEGCDR